MKFRSIQQAVTLIDEVVSANGNKQLIINHSLHFGVGFNIYTYSDDAKAAGVTYTGAMFSRLEYIELRPLLKYLLERDGKLYCV